MLSRAPEGRYTFRMRVPETAGPLAALGRRIVRCTACPRLVDYLRESKERWPGYWCRPVPGVGDPKAEVVLVGLAPGRHGANRTGRLFTGDHSGRWLYRALHEAGFCDRPESLSAGDGLRLSNVFIASAVRCAPPGNRPLGAELENCRHWLCEELAQLPHAKLYVAIGRIGHDAVLKCRGLRLSRFPFSHGALHDLGGPRMLDTYHCSRQNTNTGVLTWDMWTGIFHRARRMI